MRRGWLLLLCATLLVWRPLDFAIEFPSTLSSLGRRGLPAMIELLCHGAVAALAVAAVRALSGAQPSGVPLARLALLASVAATIQSFYWSALPHQTMPGDKLPLSILAIVIAGLWLLYLHRAREG